MYNFTNGASFAERYPSHVEQRPGLQLLQGELQLQIWQGIVCAQRRILDAGSESLLSWRLAAPTPEPEKKRVSQ